MEPEFHKWSQKIRLQQSGSMNKADLAGRIRLQQSGSMNKADLAGRGGKRRCEIPPSTFARRFQGQSFAGCVPAPFRELRVPAPFRELRVPAPFRELRGPPAWLADECGEPMVASSR